jgi:hypothetical protein
MQPVMPLHDIGQSKGGCHLRNSKSLANVGGFSQNSPFVKKPAFPTTLLQANVDNENQ